MFTVPTSVVSVQPLYGPVSGGTRVTITGQFVSVTTVTAVKIGQHILYPDKNRLSFTLILMILVLGMILSLSLFHQ